MTRLLCPVMVIVIWAAVVREASAAPPPVFQDDMDGDRPVLHWEGASEFRFLDQYVEHDGHQVGSGAEVVRFRGPFGQSAKIAYDLPAAPVIKEITLSASVTCNRPGVQIAAMVVLPRSLNRESGRPHEILLRGSNIGRGKLAEPLVLNNLPQLLQRQARVLRLQTPDPIDEREAYVRQLVFLVPGGNGVTEVMVDRISVQGVLLDRFEEAQVVAASATEEPTLVDPHSQAPISQSPSSVAPTSQAASERGNEVHRIVQWKGEDFQFLAKLGFNTIWLARAPSASELERARQLNLGLVCPPPPQEQIAVTGISPLWNPVLAWDLGDLVAADDLERVSQLKHQIQLQDPVQSRPTMMRCEQLTRSASRATDAILLGSELLGTDITLRDYITWLDQRKRLARPGTPLWTTIETETNRQRSLQIAALRGMPDCTPLPASYEQLCSLASAAMCVKCQNFVFTSQGSLENTDPASQQRRRNLELINLRLQMLAPWLSTGKVVGVAQSSQQGMSAMVFQAEHSHLLMPIRWARDYQSQYSLQSSEPVSFVVPNVAETANVYLFTLGGVKRLRHERTTGGLRVSVGMLPMDGLILLTSDPQAFSQVSYFLRNMGRRAAQLRRDVVAARWLELSQTVTSPGVTDSESIKQLLARAEAELAVCDKQLAVGVSELAYQRAQTADWILSQAEYVLRSGSEITAQSVTPLAFSVSTLADARNLQGLLTRATRGPNLLPSGDFEDLATLLAKGWRHQQLPLEGVTAAVRLTPETPYRGSYALELGAASTYPDRPVAVVPTAPVWITSPAIALKQGTLVEITGMARVSGPIVGSYDGLQIFDSLGGMNMATRVVGASQWMPFQILRAIPADTELTVTVALPGIGRAMVDQIEVRSVELPKSLAGPAPTPPDLR